MLNKRILHTVFEKEVVRVPQNIALQEENKSISYEKLNTRANQIAHLLRELDIARESVVAVLMPPGINLVVSLLGVFKSGGVYLPMDLSFTHKRLFQMLEQTEASVLITNQSLLNSVKELLQEGSLSVQHVVALDENAGFTLYTCQDADFTRIALSNNIFSTENPELINEPSDGNYIFYTSGSTGKAKGFLGCHDSLSHFIHWEMKEFGVDETFKVSQLAQITFDASLRDIFLPLSVGGTLCIPRAETKANTVQLINWIESMEITMIHCVPSLFKLIAKELLSQHEQKPVLCSLKHILMAGEPLYAKDIAQWRQTGAGQVELVNLYGTSETTLAKTFHRIADIPADPAQILHVGKPISNTMVVIMNHGLLCEPGQIGEVFIRTPFMTKGYYKDEALNREKFVQNPRVKDTVDLMHKTGDQGRYLPDGNIEIIGRLDDQVKINGIRVELNEIKQAVLSKEGIRDSVVLAHKNTDNQNELICYYIGPSVSADDLRSYLKTELNESLIPPYFIALEEFPLTINGKVDKKALPKPETLIMAEADYQAVQNASEAKLEAIFKEVLGLSRIGRKVSFFKIGGTSLKAIQVISRIFKEFDVSLKLADIFNNPSVGELTKVIQASGQTTYESIPSIPTQEYYDASHAQRRLWILDQLEENLVAYNMPVALVLHGNLDRVAMERAFRQLIERHESLRTTFLTINGELKQKIHPISSIAFTLPFTDLRNHSNGEEIAKGMAETGFAQLFDLQHGPLIRAEVMQVETHTHILVCVMHHIISDGWSMEVMMQEVLASYTATRKGQSADAFPLAIHYKDYTAWQNEQINGEKGERLGHYWKTRFSGEIPVLELPADFARPALQSYKGSQVRFSLDPTLTQNLKNLSQQQDTSLFMTLLAFVYTLSYRYTGQEDIIIGSPVAGREHQDLESQIGFYVNTLALRTHFSGAESFADLLARVKETTVGAFSHQQYPFDRLVDELEIKRDVSRSPLFDVMVALQNMPVESLKTHAVEGLTIEEYKAELPISKFDLNFVFSEEGEQIRGFVQYNTDLFAVGRIERLIDHLTNLIASATQRPETALDELEYLSADEKQQVLEIFNETAKEFPQGKSLVDLFEEQVRKTPQATAIAFEGKKISYEELNKRANCLAHYLRNNFSIQPNQLVGLLLDRSEWMTVAILGVLKSGAAYVPIDLSYPEDRKQYIVTDTKVKALIVDNIPLELLGLHCKQVISIEQDWQQIKEYALNNPVSSHTAQDLAYVIYTSGSTGQPKGTMLAHTGVVNRIHWMKNQYDFTESDVVLQKTPYVFDVSVWEFFMTICYGGTLVPCRQEVIYDPEQLIDTIENYGVTNIHFVPSMFGVLLNALNKSNLPKLTSLRHIFCSGEALKPEFVKQHHALLSCPLHNLYGPTEASVDVSYYQTTPQDTVVPIGKPVDNTQLYVLDKNLRPVGIGIAGDLYIGGIQLAKGYLHKENITAERFISNPFQPEAKLYKTGDVARWLPDGNLEYLGRSDFQVKIRGFRIEVGEIENALLRCEDIKDAVVMARTDQANSLYLVAYLTSDLAIQSNELRDFLKQRLPEYMVPAYFVRLPEIPLNANGKADRKVLPAPEGLGLDSGSVYVAPRNSLQKRLVRIWEEVLGSSLVGIASNFFELGGHSLKATQIVARIHKELDVKVELRAIFQHPTIESLASIITATGKTTFQAIEPVTPQAYYELSNTQRRIWILNQFEADQMAYNMPGGYLFKGNLNVEALEKAFAALLERHESLRTTFVLVEGQPYQKIHNSASFRFEIEKIDLSGDPVALQNVKVLADAEAETPFDLETGPLLRAILIRVAADEHIFLFTMHHIISDGWSMGVLIQNITQLYNAFSQDKGNPLGPLRIQYKDYVAWQNQAVSGESADRYKTFWKSQFNEKSPVLALPTDKKRPVVRSTQGNRVTFVLNQAITQPLKERGEQHGCTPFLTLLGVYNLFLYYYTRQTDLVVGTPVAGREHADLEDQIGLYLNMIPLRCKLDPEYTFGQLLEATCQTATQSFNYQLYPFDKLVEDLEITSEPNRHPLFDVVIDSLDFDSTAKEVQLDQVQVLDYKTEQLASKYDLILYFQETAEGFQIAFEYSTDLFEHATVTRMARRFQILTETLLKKPEATLAELCLDDKPAFARIGTARREIVG